MPPKKEIIQKLQYRVIMKRQLLLQKENNQIEEQEQFLPIIEDSNEALEEQQIRETNFIAGANLQGLIADEQLYQDARRLTFKQRFSNLFEIMEQIDGEAEKNDLFEEISHFISWAILVYATINNAIIPAWIMTVPVDRVYLCLYQYLRIAWRQLFLGMLLIPVAMFEQRTCIKQICKEGHSLKMEDIKKLCQVSLCITGTFFIFLFCFDYTNVSTVFLLGSQTNFWLSVLRKGEQNHRNEIYGQTLCSLGYTSLLSRFVIICIDSLLIDPDNVPENVQAYITSLFYKKQPLLKIMGNILPVILSFKQFLYSMIAIKQQKINHELRLTLPPYFINCCVVFTVSCHMVIVSYFIGGTTLDFDSRFGWFGMFKSGKIIEFCFISTLISMGALLSGNFINKLFDPIIPATASLFEPFLTAILCKITTVQYYPALLAFSGYALLIPGQFIIIFGQYQLKKQLEQKKEG